MNKSGIVKVFAFALVCFGLQACREKDPVTTDSLSVNPQELLFPCEASSLTVNVEATGDWTFSSQSGAWFSLSQTSGTGAAQITVSAQENKNTSERNGSFSLRSGSLNSTVTLRQQAAAPVMPNAILDVDFTKSLASFTIEDKTTAPQIETVWKSNSSYGAVASGYSDTDAASYDTESWLVSPEIDLTLYKNANLNFNHAANKGTGAVSDYCKLMVYADGKWTEISNRVTYPAGNSWTYVSSGDISLLEFCGKVIKIAFAYRSTPSSSYNWEIKTLSMFRDSKDNGNTYKAVPAWMELPAVNYSSNFIVHTSLEGESYVRNYSLLNSPEDLVAEWIAYPHCDYYLTRKTDRTDAWAFDPFVGKEDQPNLTKSGDFYANGYERGHQLASADRYVSQYMNAQTFYYTNMAPMLGGAKFNSGIWGKVEDKVRDWCKSKAHTDTLYVVTGSVLKGSTTKVKDNDGDPVTVPVAYYKALLRYSKSDISTEKYIGCAFYFEHKDYSGVSDYKGFAMSIDELEKKLDMDFFPNLEAVLGKEGAAKVEAENPVDNAFWWNN